MDINTRLATAIALTLTRFPDAELHALSLGAEFNRLDPVNIAFPLALEADLIHSDGYFKDRPELQAALQRARCRISLGCTRHTTRKETRNESLRRP